MKTVMISQRMKNIPDEEIQENRKKLINYIKTQLFKDEEVEIVDNYFKEYPPMGSKNPAVWYLGKSIQKLSEVDVLLVEKYADDARGCRVEIVVSEAYGIDIVYAPELD